MSSEPVSDEELTRLIESAFVVRERKLLSLLTELKSRRAQQAEPPAGCAELAKAVAEKVHAIEMARDRSSFVRIAEYEEVIAAKLAPLFTLIAECLEEIANHRMDAEYDRDNDECEGHAIYHQQDVDRMTAIISKLDAVLDKGDADGGREDAE